MSNGFSSGFACEWDKKRWDTFVKRVQKNVSKPEIDKVLNGTAWEGVKTLASKMPKTGKGDTARGWKQRKAKDGVYSVFNTSKVALFLEDGTRDHGPKDAKWLYIPLRPGARVWRKGLVYDKDYSLAKKVKGIDAMHYLKPASNEILEDMVNRFVLHLVKV